jgi:hypothetical protein
MVPPRYLFDRWGTCLACIDDAERFVDRDGRPLGQVVRNGKVYDGDGRYRGRIDVLGQYWSERGAFVGYIGPIVERRAAAAAAGRSKS